MNPAGIINGNNASTGESQWADEDAQNHEADYEESLVTSLKSPDLATDHATKLPDGGRDSNLLQLHHNYLLGGASLVKWLSKSECP